MNLIWQVGSVASERSIIAWWGRVNQILHDGCVCHGECTKNKAPCNASNRSKRYTYLAEAGIEKAVEDRNEKDERKRVNILHDVIGDAMELHSTSWYQF